MPSTLEQLTADALTLPENLRAELAQRLIESLPSSGSSDVGEGYCLAAEQVDEIRRRAATSDIQKLVPAEELFARLNRPQG
ncbi:MAG: hypothetical protein JWQ44_704 [Chthoniobacter sp.]|jgi:hypothetical protein|nr:hypothetical protein [Chthoniobacter sp.]